MCESVFCVCVCVCVYVCVCVFMFVCVCCLFLCLHGRGEGTGEVGRGGGGLTALFKIGSSSVMHKGEMHSQPFSRAVMYVSRFKGAAVLGLG